jgi:RNA polymerase sigma-70 factor (ECF subfamily)
MLMTTENLWETFHTGLKHFILQRIPDEQSADDVLQETFLKIHTRIATLRDEEKLQSWMYQIARNAIADYYREALILTEYKGLNQRELAERLGLSFSGAKSRVQREREKLKTMLLDCCHFEFDRLGKIIDYQPNCACCTDEGCSPGCR